MVDVEIVGRVERRRKWTADEKRALLAEIEAEGGRVLVVARRHGISESLLYNWRSAWKTAVSLRSSAAVEFVPVGVIGQAREAGLERTASVDRRRPPDRAGLIEFDLPNGVQVRVDSSVDETALHRVFRALKGGL